MRSYPKNFGINFVNFSNDAGLHSQTNISNPSLLDCQDAVQEYMYKLIEKIKNEKDYSISFSLVEHGIENLIIDEIDEEIRRVIENQNV